VRPEAIDDLFLIVGMVMIAYGFWDPTRLVLILGGSLIIFVILVSSNDGGKEKAIRGPEEKTG